MQFRHRWHHVVALVAALLFLHACAESEVSNPRGTPDPVDAGDVGDADGEDGGDVGDAGEEDGGDAEALIDIGTADTGADTNTAECQNDMDCEAPAGAEGTCSEFGRCMVGCKEGYVDLDNDIDTNGCECQKTNGGLEVCDNSDNDCDGDVDEDFDTADDPMNCGMCGNVCQFDHGMAGCQMGKCVLTACEQGWKDCDGNPANGCEVDISSSTDHCGACNNKCDIANASATCEMGTCKVDMCDMGFDDCNGNPADGCEADLSDDANHCGMCGTTCGDANTTSAGCRSGSCFIGGCKTGWDNCDGNLDNGCEQDITSSNSNCGACGNICQIPHAQNVCKKGVCEKEKCLSGWHDLNGKKSDGCEYQCNFIAKNDVPDAKGTDENCDGIDGMLNQSIFVALSSNGGNNSNSGKTPDKPVESIAKGIALAKNCSPKCDVLVSAGTYNETVRLEPNVDVYGGYSGKNWDRDVSSHRVTIKGPGVRTVIAKDIFNPTEFDGFTVKGKDVGGNGQSTYAIWVDNSLGKNLTIDNVRVEAGNGGIGRDGGNGGNGADGGDGRRASGNNGGSGGNSACGADGGNGGTGRNQCKRFDGQDGRAGGDSTSTGNGGRGGNPECGGRNDCADDARNGGNGSHGSNGAGGGGATDQTGRFSGSGFWSGDSGSSGQRGKNGGGGGGGGAGGYDDDNNIWPVSDDSAPGAGGGGGGAGGCGGGSGRPGKAGGGSFGIVLVGSDIKMTATTVVMGNGGDGGDGGDGGNGGRRGTGKTGANGVCKTDTKADPGDGARGGNGGHGGGGGGGAGGCGGVSIGIALVKGANAAQQNVSFKGGQPGSGGKGGRGGYRGDQANRAKDGTDGCTGAKANVQKY